MSAPIDTLQAVEVERNRRVRALLDRIGWRHTCDECDRDVWVLMANPDDLAVTEDVFIHNDDCSPGEME